MGLSYIKIPFSSDPNVGNYSSPMDGLGYVFILFSCRSFLVSLTQLGVTREEQLDLLVGRQTLLNRQATPVLSRTHLVIIVNYIVDVLSENKTTCFVSAKVQ